MSDSEDSGSKITINQAVDKLSQQLGQVSASIKKIDQRISVLETPKEPFGAGFGYVDKDHVYMKHKKGSHEGEDEDEFFNKKNYNASKQAVPVEDFSQDYELLRKSLDSVKVDKQFTFIREISGIKCEDQKAYNVISKCANLAETVIKLVQGIPAHEVSPDRLNNIFLCGVAQLAYLRDEAASLFVKGEYGDNAARLYRHMQKSTVINPSSVEVLKSAVQLAAIQDQEKSNQYSRGRGGYSRSYRGGGGGYRGNNFRGGYNRFNNRSVSDNRDYQYNNNNSASADN